MATVLLCGRVLHLELCLAISRGKLHVTWLLYFVLDLKLSGKFVFSVIVLLLTEKRILCRRVTSTPYSRMRTSRWHGYRVCDAEVTVEGPHHRLQDVQKALGRLKDFTTLTDTLDSNSSYENSDIDDDVDNNSYILIDSASDSSTSTQPLSDTTIDNTNILATPPLKRKHDSDSDATPLVTPPFKTYSDADTKPIRTPLVHVSTDKQDSDSDATPVVTPPPTRTVTIIH